LRARAARTPELTRVRMCAWQLKSVPLLSDYFRKWLRLPDKYSDADFYRAWHDAGGPVPGKTYRFAGKGSVGKLQDRFGKGYRVAGTAAATKARELDALRDALAGPEAAHMLKDGIDADSIIDDIAKYEKERVATLAVLSAKKVTRAQHSDGIVVWYACLVACCLHFLSGRPSLCAQPIRSGAADVEGAGEREGGEEAGAGDEIPPAPAPAPAAGASADQGREAAAKAAADAQRERDAAAARAGAQGGEREQLHGIYDFDASHLVAMLGEMRNDARARFDANDSAVILSWLEELRSDFSARLCITEVARRPSRSRKPQP
jgi:hypothetical protein